MPQEFSHEWAPTTYLTLQAELSQIGIARFDHKALASATFSDTVWLIVASEAHLAVVVREAPPLEDTALRKFSQLWHYLLHSPHY